MGFNTIANYGPFQSPRQVELFGFRPWGECHEWQSLIRQNHLLGVYGVKYIVAADQKFTSSLDQRPRRFVPVDPQKSLLGELWQTEQDGWAARLGAAAKLEGDGEKQIVTLRTPLMFLPSQAWKELTTDGFFGGRHIFRISFDARAPQGGAAGYLRAELVHGDTALGLTVEPEQIGARWRHFEGILFSNGGSSSFGPLRIMSPSERPIEVRNLTLATVYAHALSESCLMPGAYQKLVELPPVNEDDPPVVIYRNWQWRPPSGRLTSATTQPASRPSTQPASDLDDLEWLKYPPAGANLDNIVPADISIPPTDSPAKLLWCVTLPVGVFYVVMVLLVIVRNVRGVRRP